TRVTAPCAPSSRSRRHDRPAVRRRADHEHSGPVRVSSPWDMNTAEALVRRGHWVGWTPHHTGEIPQWPSSSLTTRRPGGLERGMNQRADAVKVTLGPKGRNAVLDESWCGHPITNDGVSIAKEIELDDPYEKIGSELVKEVAKKTDDIAGDGTTTATVLAQALVKEGLRNVAAGANPIALKRGIDKAVAAVSETLLAQAHEIETKEQIASTAAISAADE